LRLAACLLAGVLFVPGAPARAHKPSDSYLTLQVDGARISGHWDIALRDLDFALGLDADGDGRITWGELRARHAAIAAQALARLDVQADGAPCSLSAGEQLVDRHTDGAYTVIALQGDCPRAPAALTLTYRLFAEIDPQHRGLLRLETPGGTRTAVLGPHAPTQQFQLESPDRLRQFLEYAREGVWHIWIGYDHILFLLSLLLPAVLVRQGSGWTAAGRFRDGFIDVVKIVTSFTVAHSITLTLATLGLVSLPSRWVESAIAASVVLAALNNLVPLFQGRRWTVAFLFGLIHGFGFASVLADLGLPREALLLALVGFNLGVEAGQLAIVSVFLPAAFLSRGTWVYQRAVFVGGSVLIALIAAAWLVERAFDLQLPSRADLERQRDETTLPAIARLSQIGSSQHPLPRQRRLDADAAFAIGAVPEADPMAVAAQFHRQAGQRCAVSEHAEHELVARANGLHAAFQQHVHRHAGRRGLGRCIAGQLDAGVLGVALLPRQAARPHAGPRLAHG
jgi:hypothetical protein